MQSNEDDLTAAHTANGRGLKRRTPKILRSIAALILFSCDDATPLRDRYAILHFSATGAVIRMFSNVAEIPPLFPPSQSTCYGVAWGAKGGKK
jgi:hypothetical protein